MELIYRDLANYCTQVIEDFELRVKHTLNVIDSDRCSLQHADYSLYSEMESAISDYCEENNLDFSEIDIETLIYS